MPLVCELADTVSVSPDKVFYLTKSRNPRTDPGIAVTTRIPRPMSCMIARLLHSSWLMNAYIRKRGNPHVHISTAGGKQLVLLWLESGERLAFSVKYLVGFCDRLSLKTDITMSIAAFAIDRNFIQQATGPGFLVLEASGTPLIERSAPSTFHPHQLLAWSPDTVFEFDQVYSFVDIYLNDLRVTATPKGEGSVILNADVASSGPSRHPLWRLIRSVYTPW